jgi:ubiquinone/menaquinone biosynthesis C-methylase UbiE
VIRWLDRVVPAPAEAPAPLETKEAMQRVTRQTAFEPATWTPERAAKVAELFNGMADSWNERQQAVSRYEPLEDALTRGDVGGGRCLEVGSGTGLVTPALAQRFDSVVALDLSHAMLVRATGVRIEADANALPLLARSIDCAVLVNALLFPSELDRVLAPGGRVLWVNTRGAETPIHLPPEDVAAALPGAWTGVAAEAGLGIWAVVRRS